MKKTLSILLSVLLTLSVFSVGFSALAEEGPIPDSDARAMLDLVNDFRTGSDAWYWNEDKKTKTVLTDLKPFVYDENLEKIAKIRAKELTQLFSHSRPDGTDSYTCTVKDDKGNIVEMDAENIAAGTNMTMEKAFERWLEKNENYDGQGHRRNMLDSKLTNIGIAGYDAGDGWVYWAMAISDGETAPAVTTKPAKPAATKITGIKGAKKAIRLNWKKVTKNNSGYQIQLALDKKFKKGKKTINVKGVKNTSTTVKKLKAKKKYFVRIRCFNTVDKTNYYSGWSKVKTIKTKG